MERVVYKKNPLIEVIIQYRFPQILALNANDPVEFQNAIKGQYPLYRLELENEQEVSFAINGENAMPPIPSIIQKPTIKNHNFISADGLYKINLTNSFISISTLAYTRWEEMLEHFKNPLAKFEEMYLPPFYERIGLRYIDAFSRTKLGLESSEWKELINPFYLGALQSVDERKVVFAGVDVEYQMEDPALRMKIHSGLGNVNNSPDRVFIIDSDSICIKNIEKEESMDILDKLHSNAKEVIGEAITEKLHSAMEPEKA